MIWAFVAGLPRWVKIAAGGVLAVALLLGLWLWIGAREEADDKNNQAIGAAVQREGDLRETVERVEHANKAAENVRRDDDAMRAECLRNARNPENC